MCIIITLSCVKVTTVDSNLKAISLHVHGF